MRVLGLELLLLRLESPARLHNKNDVEANREEEDAEDHTLENTEELVSLILFTFHIQTRNWEL